MGVFLTTLKTEQLTDGTLSKKPLFKLTGVLLYQSNTIKQLITVPEGFITDFATVPRLPVVYLLLGNLGNYAATIHDFLYTYPHLANTGVKNPVTRKQADEVLKDAILDGMLKTMESETQTYIARKLREIEYTIISNLFYIGVRVGGKSHWGRKTK